VIFKNIVILYRVIFNVVAIIATDSVSSVHGWKERLKMWRVNGVVISLQLHYKSS